MQSLNDSVCVFVRSCDAQFLGGYDLLKPFRAFVTV
jgi:hypothetical protein